MTKRRDTIPYPKLLLNTYRAGKDFIDARCDFIGVDDLSFSTGSSDDWEFDQDPDHSLDIAEPRAYCHLGTASFSFTGDALVLRISLSDDYGTASVVIDSRPAVTVTCDSLNSAWASEGDEIQDITIATGLSNTTHTVTITCTNSKTAADGNQIFVLHGAKAYAATKRTINIPGWLITHSDNTYGYNTLNLAITNSELLTASSGGGSADILPADFTYPDTYVDPSNGSTQRNSWDTDRESADGISKNMASGEIGSLYTEFYGPLLQIEVFGTYDGPLLRVYVDGVSVGTVNADSNTNGSDGEDHWQIFTVSNSLGPGLHTVAIYSPLSDDYYCGISRLIQDPSAVPAVSQTAYVNLSATTSVDVYSSGTLGHLNKTESSIDGGTSFDISAEIPVTSSTTKGIYPISVNLAYAVPDSSGSVVVGPYKFRPVTETLTINYELNSIPGFPLENVRIENGIVTWDPIDYDRKDYSIPMSNEFVTEVKVYGRPAAIGCTFENTSFEIAKLYDVFYADPSTLSRAQVEALQDMGVRVFGYITLGEEDGQPASPFDYDNIGPVVGDGQGPEGYASYYLSNPDGTIAGNTFWESYYPNPSHPDWIRKARDYFLPPVLDVHPEPDVETLPLAQYTGDFGTETGVVVSHAPLDIGIPVVAIHVPSGLPFPDAYADTDTGAIYLSLDPLIVDDETEVTPQLGDMVTVTYNRRALGCYGLLIDTLDAVDDYPSLYPTNPAEATRLTTAMGDLVRTLHDQFPDKPIQTERGFTVTSQIEDIVSGNFLEDIVTYYDEDDEVWRLWTESQLESEIWPLLDQANDIRSRKLYDVAAINYTNRGLPEDPFYEQTLETTMGMGFPSNVFRLNLDITRPPPDVDFTSGPIRNMKWRLIYAWYKR